MQGQIVSAVPDVAKIELHSYYHSILVRLGEIWRSDCLFFYVDVDLWQSSDER
jgi:hypothetical protein